MSMQMELPRTTSDALSSTSFGYNSSVLIPFDSKTFNEHWRKHWEATKTTEGDMMMFNMLDGNDDGEVTTSEWSDFSNSTDEFQH